MDASGGRVGSFKATTKIRIPGLRTQTSCFEPATRNDEEKVNRTEEDADKAKDCCQSHPSSPLFSRHLDRQAKSMNNKGPAIIRESDLRSALALIREEKGS
jgi:hypothetical protein